MRGLYQTTSDPHVSFCRRNASLRSQCEAASSQPAGIELADQISRRGTGGKTFAAEPTGNRPDGSRTDLSRRGNDCAHTIRSCESKSTMDGRGKTRPDTRRFHFDGWSGDGSESHTPFPPALPRGRFLATKHSHQ